ncbi:MAG TPA: hypothetical protein VF170_03290, partial [Planctomycetaceae bacterium]
DGAEGRFAATFDALERLAAEHDIAIAVVDGLAAIHHGYATTTEDVDILLSTEQQEVFLRAAPDYGFKVRRRSPKGWHILEHISGVEVNVVPEGGTPRDDAPVPIPSPARVGVASGVAYASLEGWVELKLGSNRLKDRAHVVEVLKAVGPTDVDRVRGHLRAVHPVLAERFEELVRTAEEERRGPE